MLDVAGTVTLDSGECVDARWTSRGVYRCIVVADPGGSWFTRADGRRQRLDGTMLDVL